MRTVRALWNCVALARYQAKSIPTAHTIADTQNAYEHSTQYTADVFNCNFLCGTKLENPLLALKSTVARNSDLFLELPAMRSYVMNRHKRKRSYILKIAGELTARVVKNSRTAKIQLLSGEPLDFSLRLMSLLWRIVNNLEYFGGISRINEHE